MTNPNKTLALLPSFKNSTQPRLRDNIGVLSLKMGTFYVWLCLLLVRFVLVLTQFKRAHICHNESCQGSRIKTVYNSSDHFHKFPATKCSGNNLDLSCKGRYLESGPIIIILLHSAIYGDQRKYLWSFQCRCWTEESREPLRQSRPKPFNTSPQPCEGPSNLINYQITLHSRLLWMLDAKISFSPLIRPLMTGAKSP